MAVGFLDPFVAHFGRTPTVNAEGLDRIGGPHRKGLGETHLYLPSDRHGSSAFAVGMLRCGMVAYQACDELVAVGFGDV